jgi:hypothetical protein
MTISRNCRSGRSPSIPNDVTEAGLAQIEYALAAASEAYAAAQASALARPLPPRGETFATGPPGARPRASYLPRPTTPKYGLAHQ